MNKLRIVGLPHSVTDDELYDAFAQFGSVVSAKTIRDQNGNSTGAGTVEMRHAGDVGEIVESTDRLGFGGTRPHIWPVYETISEFIHASQNGIHLAYCAGRWYVFKTIERRLRWCRPFAVEIDAQKFHAEISHGSRKPL